MNTDVVASAAPTAALVAWTCALAFLGWYAWTLRVVLRRRRGRPGRTGAYSWHLVVVHGDFRVDVHASLDRVADAFPDAHLWLAARDEVEVGHGSAPPRWRPIPGGGELLERIHREISDRVPVGADRRQVVIGLVDSADVLDPDARCHLAGRDGFDDPRVGGVQVGERVQPARVGGSLLHRLQDIEARGPLAASQLRRRRSLTALLGGSGQFVRLSALDDVVAERTEDVATRSHVARRGARPVRTADDLDQLTARLWGAGWGTTFTADTWVHRPGAADLGEYLAERRRSSDATFDRAGEPRRLRDNWAGTRELTAVLLQPWSVLVGTVLAVVLGLAVLAVVALQPTAAWAFWSHGGWLVPPALYVIAFGELPVWGVAYGRRLAPRVGSLRGLTAGLAHGVVGVVQVLAVWAAFSDLLRDRGLRLPRAGVRGRRVAAGGRRRQDAGSPLPHATVRNAIGTGDDAVEIPTRAELPLPNRPLFRDPAPTSFRPPTFRPQHTAVLTLPGPEPAGMTRAGSVGKHALIQPTHRRIDDSTHRDESVSPLVGSAGRHRA